VQSIDLIHPDMANVAKADIKAKLGKTLKVKEECISIFGMKTKFGGGSSSGFALIYESADARRKYDSKPSLRRVSNAFDPRVGPKITARAIDWVCALLSRQSLKTNKPLYPPNTSSNPLVPLGEDPRQGSQEHP